MEQVARKEMEYRLDKHGATKDARVERYYGASETIWPSL